LVSAIRPGMMARIFVELVSFSSTNPVVLANPLAEDNA